MEWCFWILVYGVQALWVQKALFPCNNPIYVRGSFSWHKQQLFSTSTFKSKKESKQNVKGVSCNLVPAIQSFLIGAGCSIQSLLSKIPWPALRNTVLQCSDLGPGCHMYPVVQRRPGPQSRIRIFCFTSCQI